jgi:hypothetical protein
MGAHLGALQAPQFLILSIKIAAVPERDGTIRGWFTRATEW